MPVPAVELAVGGFSPQHMQQKGKITTWHSREHEGGGNRLLWQTELWEGMICELEGLDRSPAGCHTCFSLQQALAWGECCCCFSKEREFMHILCGMAARPAQAGCLLYKWMHTAVLLLCARLIPAGKEHSRIWPLVCNGSYFFILWRRIWACRFLVWALIL